MNTKPKHSPTGRIAVVKPLDSVTIGICLVCGKRVFTHNGEKMGSKALHYDCEGGQSIHFSEKRPYKGQFAVE